jgi:hypothetical protein
VRLTSRRPCGRPRPVSWARRYSWLIWYVALALRYLTCDLMYERAWTGYPLCSGRVYVHWRCGGVADVCAVRSGTASLARFSHRVIFGRLLEESKSGKQALREVRLYVAFGCKLLI